MATSTDRQLTGMAGEFLVVGQLFKRHLQASVTFGNAKAIDVLAHNPRTDKVFSISVKTLRKRNCYPLNPKSVSRDHTYIFVLLNPPGEAEQYFIVPGSVLKKNLQSFFGASLTYEKRAAVNFGPLRNYEDNWRFFEN